MKIFASHPDYTFVLELCRTLKARGFMAWLAGGCVRDGLMGVLPNDFDIATDATPEEVEVIFPKTVSVGKIFGVIRVLGPSEKGIECDIEVASFRKDGLYVDGRRPENVEKATPEEDALRRDFTVNALFWDPFEEKVYDFVDGVSDLRKKVLRAVGDPRARFKEDRLRMLRAVRFLMQLGFSLDVQTEEALLAEGEKTSELSGERMLQELSKMLKTSGFDVYFPLLLGANLFKTWLPVRTSDVQLLKVAGRNESSGWLCFFCEWFMSSQSESRSEWFKDAEKKRRWAFSGDQKKMLEFLSELLSAGQQALSDEDLGGVLKRWCSFPENSWRQFFLSLREQDKIVLRSRSPLFVCLEKFRPDLMLEERAWTIPENFLSFESLSQRYPEWSDLEKGKTLKRCLDLQLVHPQKTADEIEQILFLKKGDPL